MAKDWSELTKLTNGADISIERVRLTKSNIAIEGEFELPKLARLSSEEQIFIMAFIKCHGSIKDMEEMFGISYPTVKNRLNRLADKLKLVQSYPCSSDPVDKLEKSDVLSRLERGEISAEEAIERLKQ